MGFTFLVVTASVYGLFMLGVLNVAATILMALGIALIELPCIAGFPFIWSSLVADLDLSPLHFILLFIVL